MAASNEDLPDRDEQAALWCQSLADGPLHPEAQASFDNWLADPANARAFDDATRVWRAVDAASDHPEIIQLRREALASFWRANRNRWNRGIKRRYWLGAIAASLILALVGVAVLGNRAEIYQTGTAERRVVTLEDGSKVFLDADTSIGVRMGADRRELTLTEGRAKFDVAKNALRPFTVTAGDKIVVATGTSFSVEVVGGQVHVLLYEGRVAVLDATDRRPVPQHLVDKASMDDQLLVPGKELTVPLGTARTAVVSDANLQQSISWVSGQLNFDDEPLSTAVVRMNRYSTKRLVVGDPAAGATRVTGVFTAGDVDAFVEAVTMLTPVRATQVDGTVTLRRN